MNEPSEQTARFADVEGVDNDRESRTVALNGLVDGLAFAQLRTEEHWLVDGLIRPRSVNLFQGDPGSMKTWLALELIRAVATGSPFLGSHHDGLG